MTKFDIEKLHALRNEIRAFFFTPLTDPTYATNLKLSIQYKHH